ncbi:MAG: hypothetical protein AYK22_04895 [Thermoplasmatales archaeon SG8-52-3]|nr:MAG: hypothetical protein AYK22_04895 [Thermoplasmatales archaeon SG8-52-3]
MVYFILEMVNIKSRSEVLNDVIKDGKKYPDNWKAVFGKDNKRLSRDYYIFNPRSGIYLLKEYEKNPFEIKGIGGKIARRIDEDIEAVVSKKAGDFGIIQGDYQKIIRNLEKGIKPEKIFDAAFKGKKNLGISIPIKGQASTSKEVFKNIHHTYYKEQQRIDKKLEKMANEDGLYKSYE